VVGLGQPCGLPYAIAGTTQSDLRISCGPVKTWSRKSGRPAPDDALRGLGATWASFDDSTVAEFKAKTGLNAKTDLRLGDFET